MKKNSQPFFYRFCWLAKKLVFTTAMVTCSHFLYGQNTAVKDVFLDNKGNNFSLQSGSTASTIKPSEREAQIATSFEELMTGRISGARIVKNDGAPGASFSMQLRGVRSYRGDNEPLYILDGVILNPAWKDALKTFWNDTEDYQSSQNILSHINANDIDRIEVLKDATATAIYGSMGANGVVLITTKNGSGSKSSVSWHSNVGISTISRKINTLSKDDYLLYRASANPGVQLPFEAGNVVNWQDNVTRTALTHNHYVNIGGNSDRMRYYVSVGYSNSEGIIERSNDDLMTIRLNFDRRIGKNGVFGTRLLFSYKKNNMIQSTTPLGSLSLTKLMTGALPFEAPTGNKSIESENPRRWLDGYDDESTQYSATPQVYFETQLIKGLNFKTVAGVDYRNKERLRWIGNETYRGRQVEGRAGKSDMNLMAYNLDSYLKYDNTFKKHAVSGTLGFSLNGENFSNRVHEGTKFFNQDLRGVGIQLAENVFPYQSFEWNNHTLSGYVNANYTFDNRYSLNATLRTDKTNKFDQGTGDLNYYPSVGISWNIANESFLAEQNIISTLKARTSWGRSGKQSILPLDLAGSYITGIDPELEIENGMTNYYDMRWNSINTQYGAGIELGLLNDKITATIDLYKSRTKDNLRYYYHKRKGDYESIYSNKASVVNRGFEIGLNGVAVKNSLIKWNIGGTFAFNRNKIKDTGAEGDVFGNTIGVNNGSDVSVNVNRKGASVGSFWGYKSQGIVRNEHVLFTPPFNGTRLQPGDIKFLDMNGDGNVTEDDRTVIGNPIPKYVFGIYTDFHYKNLSLQLLFNGAAKYDIINLNGQNDIYAAGNLWNVRKGTYLNAYSASNTNGNSPRLDAVGVREISSRVIESGSHLRLSDMILGYDMPLPSVKWIETIGFTFTAKNLFVITSYSGYDPNVNSYGYDLSSLGIDNGAYPGARSFLVGVKVKF